jgi:LCP family protein required for cell wall assembly
MRGSRGTRWLRRVTTLAAVLTGAALVVPAASVHPTSISMTTIGTAKAVDAGDGVLWVLALGSEAAAGDDVTTGLTDAIQLIGVNLDTGRAVAIGLPRDLYVEIGDGRARLNTALRDEGTDGVAREVDDLLGIEPDVVVVTGFDGFLSMMGAVGDVRVDSPQAFTTEDGGVRVRRGTNTFDADEALYFARTRDTLPGGSDFERAANHQRLLLGVLERLRTAEDEAGFMEEVALSALGGLQTDMSPAQVYRLVQALTTVDPGRTDACIIVGTFGVESGASVVYPDTEQARAVGRDAQDDARLQGGCRDGAG